MPQKIAIFHYGEKLSYKLLNEKANQLAYLFFEKGFKDSHVIGIYLEPSIETIISILAILKIGGCYLPLDTAYPAERLKYMLADSNAKAVITTKKLAENIDVSKKLKFIHIDDLEDQLKLKKKNNPKTFVNSESNAYVIYTSGTIGKPKGVKIHHQAINNHMVWMGNHFKFCKMKKFCLKHLSLLIRQFGKFSSRSI